MLKNTKQGYGLISRLVHWLVAITVIGLFASGLYMVDLGYYDSLYHVLPWWHKSIGIALGLVLLIWSLWRIISPSPPKEKSLQPWEHFLAVTVQWLMFILVFVVVILGYLISTAAGDGISVFGLFEVPAIVTSIENQADVAGFWHFYAAWALILLAALHALAAIKHHFIDKDRTLMRMIKGR